MVRATAAGGVLLCAVACAPQPQHQPPAPGGDGGTVGVVTTDLCAFLAGVESNMFYELPGDHSTPYDLGPQPCVLAPAAGNLTLRAAPGANPLVKGFLTIYGANTWVLDNIDFTIDPVPAGAQTAQEANRHGGLLKFVGGTGWKVLNSELFFPDCPDCGDFAALSFGFTADYATPTNWEISGNWLHDNPGCVAQPFCTVGTNQSNVQNHFIYGIGNPAAPMNGVIRDNLLVNSPNGFAIKLGGSGSYDGSQGVNTVLIENNTVVQDHSVSQSASGAEPSGYPVLIDDDCSNLSFRRNILHDVSTTGTDPASLTLGTGFNFFGKGFSTGITFDENVMTSPLAATVLYFQGCAANFLARSPDPVYGYARHFLGCGIASAILSITNTLDGTSVSGWPQAAPGICAPYAPVVVDGTTYGAPASVCTGP